LAALLWAGAVAAECAPDAVAIRGDFGEARFRVAVADDPVERAQGLMGVPEMPTGSGMLFLYDRPQRATFWMRNTLIPLDMIFAGSDGVVTRVHENAVPLDESLSRERLGHQKHAPVAFGTRRHIMVPALVHEFEM